MRSKSAPVRAVEARIRVVFTIVMVLMAEQGRAEEPFSLARRIDLPRVEGRIDHLAFDAASQHLFVAALGNNTVEVLDVSGGTIAVTSERRFGFTRLADAGATAHVVYERPSRET